MAETRRREVIRLAELADEASMITDVEFEDCEVVGPAVIVLLEDVVVSGCTFTAPPEALFIPAEPDRPLVGVIGLQRVKLIECRIRNVGIIGPPEAIEDFKRGMQASE